MSVNQAARQLLEIVQNQRTRGEDPGTQGPNMGLRYSPPAAWRFVCDRMSDTCRRPTATEARVDLKYLCYYRGCQKIVHTF